MSQATGQTAAAFAWDDFLSLAVEWQANAAASHYPAAVYRSSISRAYYAVFHAAFDLAATLGLQSTGAGVDHYHLRKFFERRGRMAAQLSAILRSLYDLRISADYERQARNPVTTDAPVATAEAIRLAQQAMQWLANLQAKGKS